MGSAALLRMVVCLLSEEAIIRNPSNLLKNIEPLGWASAKLISPLCLNAEMSLELYLDTMALSMRVEVSINLVQFWPVARDIIGPRVVGNLFQA